MGDKETDLIIRESGLAWNEFAGCWDTPCGLSHIEGCVHEPECSPKVQKVNLSTRDILEKLDYVMNCITNERSDLAEPVVLDLIFYYKQQKG